MANRRFNQFFYSLHNKPVLLDCNFKVDAADVSGKGIINGSLKGPGIANVFMNSSASFSGATHTNTVVDGISSTANLRAGMPIQGSGIPAGTTIASITSSSAIVISQAASASATVTISYQAVGNPNPGAGVILVQLQDCYNKYFGGNFQAGYALTGSDLTSVTVNLVYVITALGTATLAQWQAKGLPAGITPAVGAAFVASATGTIGGSATVKAVGSSGIDAIEVIGDPNKTIQSSAALVMGVSSGAYLLFQCLGPSGSNAAPALTMNSYTPAGTNDGGTPPIFTGTPATLTGTVAAPAFTGSQAAKAPAQNSLLQLEMYLSSSSILVQGE